MSDHIGSQILTGAALFVAFAVLTAALRRPNVPPKKKRFRCVALDLDGTTLNSQHEISAHTKSVLHRLHGNGVKVGLHAHPPFASGHVLCADCG